MKKPPLSCLTDALRRAIERDDCALSAENAVGPWSTDDIRKALQVLVDEGSAEWVGSDSFPFYYGTGFSADDKRMVKRQLWCVDFEAPSAKCTEDKP